MRLGCTGPSSSWQLLLSLLLLALLSAAVSAEPDKCSVCNRLTEAFERGLQRTAKDNFGGGNTHWEESRLGSWASSETRLVDIQERLCADEGKEEATACHALLEQFEEPLEAWWFGEFRRDSVKSAAAAAAILRDLLCVRRGGLCCQHGAFGPQCAACPDCGQRGQCDGNGTRAGGGRCTCQAGYRGDLCDQCEAGRYLAASSPLLCLACHPACGSAGCIGGPGETDCRDCAAGYQPGAEGADGRVSCVDVDECAASPGPCAGQNETCVNSPGSFSCDCLPGFRRPDSGGDCQPETGGDSVETGGDSVETGGDSVETGGDSVETGGDSVETGGDSVETGGDSVETGGDSVETGGDSKETGGDSVETGGDSKETGGDSEETGGDTPPEPAAPTMEKDEL